MIRMDAEFNKLAARIERYRKINFLSLAHSAGKFGVRKLSDATPKDTGEASRSWFYEVKQNSSYSFTLIFDNDDKIVTGERLVLLIEFGHGVRGGFVKAHQFIYNNTPLIVDKFIEDLEEALRI